MKSVNVFLFCSILPCVVPGLAEVAAAADVGDGEDHAAVEQAQVGRVERHRESATP